MGSAKTYSVPACISVLLYGTWHFWLSHSTGCCFLADLQDISL